MGKLISSFDNTKLYLNKEVPDNCKAVAVVVHGLCRLQVDMIILQTSSMKLTLEPIVLTIAAMAI